MERFFLHFCVDHCVIAKHGDDDIQNTSVAGLSLDPFLLGHEPQHKSAVPQ